MVDRFSLTSRAHRIPARACAVAVISLALCCSFASAPAAQTDIADLMRAIKELREQNRVLARRITTLEAERAEREPVPPPPPSLVPAPLHIPVLKRKIERPPEVRPARLRVPPAKPVRPLPPLVTRRMLKTKQAQARPPPATSRKRLEERVKELEDAKTAQEDATRAIIRDSLSTLGSKINEAVTLGGALEVLGSRSSSFQGTTTDKFELNTAELDLEVQVSDWVLGNLTLEFLDSTSDSAERISLDTAFLTLGDTQRFPIYVKAGRVTLPFGTSTGVQRADVLSIDSPLTIDAFETRKTAIEFGFALPTPTPGPAPRGVVVPPVRPLVVNPLVSSFAKFLGYKPPPPRPTPPSPVAPTPVAPPFYGSFSFFEGNTDVRSDRSFFDNINGELGYRTQGHCGRPYSDLRGSAFCPWSIDFNVNYNSSIFESRFFETEYSAELGDIGRVAGVAASVKATVGRMSFVGEWNGLLDDARFVDTTGKSIDIKPEAWQVALGYQFDWNPWVEVIGDQGTFFGLGYSESRDLSGIDGTARNGSLPKRRLTLTAGEWVLDGAKLLIEYSHTWDYSTSEGGTGNTANAVSGSLTYVW